MNRRGFTMVEVLVAVLVLTIGILGLAVTTGLVTRMVGQGQRYSEVSAMAAQRFEILRSQSCATMTSGDTTEGRFSIAWSVDSIGGRPPARRIMLRVTSPRAGGVARADSFSTTFTCEP